MIESLMQNLASEMEITEIAPAMPGVYVLPLEENFSLTLKEQAGCIFFTIDLGDLPKEGQEEFLMHVMHANLFGQGTSDAILALSQETSRLTLTHVIDYTIDYRDFKDAVDDFINAADMWKEEAVNFGRRHGS